MLLLDTTVLIDALRGRPLVARLRELRAAGQVPWICAINVEEMMRGTSAAEERAVVRFLAGMRLAPLGGAEGELAGRWRRDFARKGVTLSQADCLIAAAALGVGARLATGNPKHFPMPDLSVEHWPVGS
ncbi:MAG TPA: type II toxin-antitoxin system VapC family toxin [Solirubrobacteraceae bacterium]|nr:type II toxin-antitoxin system VapC family toxin [Solirubrobacteraceae bacterium]